MDELNNEDVYVAFRDLFLHHRTHADLPNREEQEERELSNWEQAEMAGHNKVVKKGGVSQKELVLEPGYNVLRTKDIFDYYDSYGWMTGLQMDTMPDGKIQGNEWEHVLPFYFQIIFGGGLHSRPRFDLDGDARRNHDLLDKLDIVNAVIISDDENEKAKQTAQVKRDSILSELAKQLDKTMDPSGTHDKFAGLPELSDDLYNDIFTSCRIDKKQSFDIAVNRNRLNILCMAKCESYINRCKTNNLFVTFYNSLNLNDRKFHPDRYRIQSFMDFVTEPLMTTEDIKDQPFWDRELWGQELRIKELPKNASLKAGIVKSPSLRPYVQKKMDRDTTELTVSINNTNLVMQAVCSQLNLYMKERVLMNCIYFLTNEGRASAKTEYAYFGAKGSLPKRDSYDEYMSVFNSELREKLINELKEQEITVDNLTKHLNDWIQDGSENGFNTQFGVEMDEYIKIIALQRELTEPDKEAMKEEAINSVKTTLLKSNNINELFDIIQAEGKKRKVSQGSPNLDFYEGELPDDGSPTVVKGRMARANAKDILKNFSQSHGETSPSKRESGSPSSDLFKTNSHNVMKHYIATCFNYLYKTNEEVDTMLYSIQNTTLIALINSLRVGAASSSGGRKKKTKRKKTRRKRRRKKKKRTRRKK
uniref:Uncharacterized protein n=1 Tax=viral metagenome TaxID=1070528 RepID=A0A6C0IPE4_9ZZZZ